MLIDTNILLDVLCSRIGFIEESSKIWRCSELNLVEGYISALSVPNIMYILRKELTPEKTQQTVHRLASIFQVAELRSDDLISAADMFASDYENAVQMCQASRIGAGYIVTRNIRDFNDSKVPVLKPEELIERI